MYASLKLLDDAIEPFRVFANPVDIFFARPGVDHQQIVVFAEPMNDHVIDKRALRVEHRRIMRLADGEFRGIVHAEVLYRRERASRRLSAANPDVAHVADIENANTRAHRFMFCDQPAARGILDGHIPAAEIHHFRAQTAVHRVQRASCEVR